MDFEIVEEIRDVSIIQREMLSASGHVCKKTMVRVDGVNLKELHEYDSVLVQLE